MNLYEIAQREMMADDEPSDKKSEQMQKAYDTATPEERLAIDEMLMALSGWTFLSLEKMVEADEPAEITCPNGCGFYAHEGTEGDQEMTNHLEIDCTNRKGKK